MALRSQRFVGMYAIYSTWTLGKYFFVTEAENAYERAERNTIPSPRKLRLISLLPVRLIRITPAKPTAHPMSLRAVSFSEWNTRADTSMERNTLEAVIIELFIPVVCDSPI